MNTIEALILNGSPGSGKSTLANALSELLRENNIAHAVIDLDELARVYPENDADNIIWKNLAAVWSNYAARGTIKVIIPVLIDSTKDQELLKNAISAKITICELVAPLDTLKSRVTEREPNEYWQKKLRGLVENYERRPDNQKYADIQVSTHNKEIDETAKEIIEKLNWI